MKANPDVKPVPGFNAPMTTGQKWVMAGMVAVALLNLAVFIAVVCL